MSDLSKLRNELEQIDRDLVRLLDRRANVARQVGSIKTDESREIYDAGQHRAVLERALSFSDGSFPREGLLTVMRELLSVSLRLQKSLRVAYLGPAATFAHQAGLLEFGSALDFTPCTRIRDIFDTVRKGEVEYGIVPIENSTGGIVHETLDSFMDIEVAISSEVLLPIRHSLLGHTTLDKVETIYSHPQTFKQCAEWLRAHLPRVLLVETPSTVAGMQRARQDPNSAAIGSDIAAELYGLHILASGIEDNPDNTTRFLVIKNPGAVSHKAVDPGEMKTSLMFSIKDRPGALFHLLKPFADRNINLSQIESRPTRHQAWQYVFFIDLAGHVEDPLIAEAIEEIRRDCFWLRVLGSYPRYRNPLEKNAGTPNATEEKGS